MSDGYIKKVWDENAVKYGTDHWASWGDHHAIMLERGVIRKLLRLKQKVLDVGCGNGHSTAYFATDVPESRFVGVDYSENMIHFARKQQVQGDIEFKVADCRDLPFADNEFDLVYTTRCIINLPTWEEQQQAIGECIRVGKQVALSEAFYEPLVRLNALRQIGGLSPLIEHDFNRYIKQDRLEKYLDGAGLSYYRNDFSSIYYLGSRFVRDLVTAVQDYPGYENPVNAWAYELENRFSGGNFGIQQMYHIKKNV